jgi:hypothetical protein
MASPYKERDRRHVHRRHVSFDRVDFSEIRADGVLANAEFGDPGQMVVTTKGGSNTIARIGILVLPELCKSNAIAYTFPTTTTKPSVTRQHFWRQRGRPGGDSAPLQRSQQDLLLRRL